MSDTARPRALLSVSDKTGLTDLARGLANRGFELVSTGGTARAIREAGLPVTDVAQVTGAPEMLDGRVKTLHPRVHGGVLANLHDPSHRAQLAEQGIEPFSVVVVNLYRFEQAAAAGDLSDDRLIEEIDIGGPALVRASAKNHANVAIVTDPADYKAVLAAIDEHGQVPLPTRRQLALKAYRRTAAYDAAIVAELASRWTPDDPTPEVVPLALRRSLELRYGENPHQRAALYSVVGADPSLGPFVLGAAPLQGKPLSYNNLLDASAAAAMARDLVGRAVVIVKHGNPCGAAEADDLVAAWERALEADRVSAFGGVVAVRGVVGEDLAERLANLFLEVVVAERFEAPARAVLAAKPDLRLLEDRTITQPTTVALEARAAGGGVLLMTSDAEPDDPASWRTVTKREPTGSEAADLAFAWRIARHVKSNAIVLARDGAIVGVGAGQMNRVQSARLAVEQAGERARGASCASDAFFPFPDAVETCLGAGVTAVVEPGGSRKDDDVIAAVDAAGATMVFTGRRHFRH
ncbi:MAG: bifunctional phosphoribosylaminoimidazolecarboxamide formyltransferase/IMP cyclohydrolase [Candidatus Limnocylindrales bacterium]